LGLPHVQIEGIVEAHNFGSQTFAIKGRLSLWICTEWSCCSGLREYLSAWVDLVGKHSSPQSFYVLMLRSLGCLESCSLLILTCDGFHDLLLKCLMNLSRKSSL
jgi:NADH:ubiquinone oxidoreductase subunit E